MADRKRSSQDALYEEAAAAYGAALEKFGTEIKRALDEHEEELYEIMREHFVKHVGPFGTRV